MKPTSKVEFNIKQVPNIDTQVQIIIEYQAQALRAKPSGRQANANVENRVQIPIESHPTELLKIKSEGGEPNPRVENDNITAKIFCVVN